MIDIDKLVEEWREKGFELYVQHTPVGDEPYCPYCGAREFHAIGWCMKHQRFECIVQREKELEEENGEEESNMKKIEERILERIKERLYVIMGDLHEIREYDKRIYTAELLIYEAWMLVKQILGEKAVGEEGDTD
ncbi:MAG: hypothetical protein DRP00_04750 [Candidatus Aenigmatarchaeota archaeon]|nr:MAG: hypothetical protein DRP00_04750 [Candidatus Aenigmarchaeota archaeon]